MRLKFKSDLVLLFEYSSGWKLEDYLYDRVNLGWGWKPICREMNAHIKKAKMEKMIRRGLFRVNQSNLAQWYKRIGLKSLVKRGTKTKKKGKKNEHISN